MGAIDGAASMATLQDRFQHLARVIASERFLKLQGLGNEAPFFICPYPPDEAVAMEQTVRQLANRLHQSGVRVLAINLYDLCVELLQERGIWELVLERPIYWLFSSPKGSFNALIYMHRYRPDTVSVVLNEYLRDFRSKLEAHKRHLEQVSISASATPREKSAALKEIGKLEKSIAELTAYENEVLYPLATQQVAIDLDDGVKVNYNKLGRALRRIVGVSG